MRNFNFEVKEKLDLQFATKFDGKYDGDSLEAQKPYLNPINGPI